MFAVFACSTLWARFTTAFAPVFLAADLLHSDYTHTLYLSKCARLELEIEWHFSCRGFERCLSLYSKGFEYIFIMVDDYNCVSQFCL